MFKNQSTFSGSDMHSKDLSHSTSISLFEIIAIQYENVLFNFNFNYHGMTQYVGLLHWFLIAVKLSQLLQKGYLPEKLTFPQPGVLRLNSTVISTL